MTRSAFGSVRRRADTGRWQARWQDGSGHQHSRTFATKREAARWLADVSTDRARGDWTDPRAGRLTFGRFAHEWRTTRVGLRPSTLARDLGYLDRYILPAFGPVPLGELDHMRVQAWVADLTAGLAPATVVKAAQIVGKITAAAVTARLIPADPCIGLELPRVERDEMRTLTPEDVWKLADNIVPAYRTVVLVGAYCGLRAGEMFGLRVDRVEVAAGRLHVTEAVTEVSGVLHAGAPKTRAGRRIVPMPAFVADELAAHVAGRRPDALVWTDTEGGPVRLSNWRQRVWRPAFVAARVPYVRIHDLRHTAVSLWISAGASPSDVAARAGHASVSTVLDRYGHLLQRDVDAVTDRLDGLGRGAR